MTGLHILSTEQFNRTRLEALFTLANKMTPYAKAERITHVLDGALMASLFFEPSTRTRISFNSAFNRLGGRVLETVGKEMTSLSKGESLADTARVISGYADVIVVRHPTAGAAAEFAAASRIPIINAGDGSNEHPTQALLDVFTLQKELQAKNKNLDGLRLALVGDLKHSRTIHSLIKLLTHYEKLHFEFISPAALALPAEFIINLKKYGHSYSIKENLGTSLKEVDAIYVSRLQEERFTSVAEAQQYRGQLRLNQAVYTQYCHPDTIIMHPLPRDSRPEARELDIDLDQHPNLAIFRQSDNGLLIRMALFCTLFGVTEKLEQYSNKTSWQTL